MKTYVVYGFGLAVAQFLATLVFFILGLHSDASKIATAQGYGQLLSVLISATVLTLGIRARRASKPPTSAFTYGNGVSTGFMIGVFSAILGCVLWYIYVTTINPQFNDLVIQSKLAELSQKGISGEGYDRAEKMIRMFMTPIWQVIFALIFVPILDTLISLIIAIFTRRGAGDMPPVMPI